MLTFRIRETVLHSTRSVGKTPPGEKGPEHRRNCQAHRISATRALEQNLDHIKFPLRRTYREEYRGCED